MEWMEMHCRLEVCEIDNSSSMTPEKCLSGNGEFRMCYQLAVKNHDPAKKGEVWKKLEDMLDKKKQKPTSSGDKYV